VQEEITTKGENKILYTKVIFNIAKYYYIYIGVFFFSLAALNYLIKVFPIEYSGYIILTGLICFTAVRDIRLDVKLQSFLKIALPFMVIILLIFINGNNLWHGVLLWEMGRGIVVNLNSLFNKIPLNDAFFARIYQTSWLTWYMKMVYNTGFVLAVIAPLFRAAMVIDFRKMVKYSLSAHIFQVFIITPFYFMFHLQEIWFVRGHADMLGRHLVGRNAIETTLNCFPSMHTSIAFAMFLLVLREKNKIFKWLWGIYCLSIIYSTMYLEIHWLIDVLGGLILGYATVKLVDLVVAKMEVIISKRLDKLTINEDNNTVIE
jgi:membrane-associated phospholipid phosphatase